MLGAGLAPFNDEWAYITKRLQLYNQLRYSSFSTPPPPGNWR